MKKTSLLLSLMLCLGLFGVNTVSAQKQNVLKLNPLSLAIGNISLSYERILSEKTSFQLQAGYWLGGTVGETKFSGMSLTPEFRYYVTDNERPKGFYLAPFARYQSITANSKTDSDASATLTRIGGGAAFGYQFLFGKSVTWDTFLGPQYLKNSVKYKDSADQGSLDLDRLSGNFGLRFGTTIGFAF
jgi:hypothetical protein